jgi:hypothetical protein
MRKLDGSTTDLQTKVPAGVVRPEIMFMRAVNYTLIVVVKRG